MEQDTDYERDVLKFKKVWDELKKSDKKPTNKNLQTIESNQKINHNKQTSKRISFEKPTKANNGQKTKPKNKQTILSTQTVTRNPHPQNPDQVINVVTRPSSHHNEKSNIAQSHLILGSTGVCVDHLKNNLKNGGMSSLEEVYELKKAIESKDHELSMLRVSNSRNQDRIRYLEKELESKGQVISMLRERERKIVGENSDLASKGFNFEYGKVEYENFKNDSRRLLKMLQSTAEYKHFAQFGLDDDGVRFLHKVNKQTKSQLDNPKSNSNTLHFCTCNKAFIPENGFWVPQKIYSFGREFIKDRKGEVTDSEFELLLYELNKIWREREKRIINSLTALKAHEVGKYKRKLGLEKGSKTKRLQRHNKTQRENEEE